MPIKNDTQINSVAQPGHCFHCGLPVDLHQPEKLHVLDEEKFFCCHGCKAVCKTIIDSGLEKYYQTRDLGVSSNQQQDLQNLLEKLSIYDNESVQKSFVHGHDNWQEAYLILEGIRCSACVWLNELHLRQQEGVLEVHIDDVTQRARVRWDPEKIVLSKILAAIVSIGYQAHPYEPSHYLELQKDNKRKNLKRILYTAIVGMIPMHFALATWFMGGVDEHGHLPEWEQTGRWISFFITFTILVYPAQEFFYGVWSDLKRRVIGMDVPIVIGLSCAFLLSAYSTVMSSGEVFYESIVMFVVFILFSRRLEQQARVKAADQLERLSLAQPVEANRIEKDGSLLQVSVADLLPGDLIHILPGEQVPVDCEIIKGQSSFNESLITGESQSIPHRKGDMLMAGSVNYDQPVQALVQSGEMESTIAEITRLAESGLQNKPVQSLIADKVASRFVWFILIIALMTSIYWWMQGHSEWLVITVSVLIVTCPCALALAVPIALTLSSSQFLKKGVLAMNMSILNKLLKVDLFVFDKTGTLTEGKPKLVDSVWLDTSHKEFALSVLQTLVGHSEHPVAKALQNSEARNQAEVRNICNHVGQGIEGVVDQDVEDEIWRFGSYEFIFNYVTDVSSSNASKIEYARNASYSTSYLSRGQRLIAIFSFEDAIRQDSQQVVSQLISNNYKTVILSGDTQMSVSKVAKTVGIDTFYSGMSPQQKMAWVNQQQNEGRVVAMFGDGINDAPTLAKADVSFSFSESTALANNHSDFLLMGRDLKPLPDSIELAHKTIQLVKQNIGWAILYNLCAIPFAVAGWVPPWMAAVGMSVSSIIVVFNSMRLVKS